MKFAAVIAVLAFAVVSLTLADDPVEPSSTLAPAPSSTAAPAPSSTPAPAPSSTPAPAPSSTPAPAPSSTPAPTSTTAPSPTTSPAPTPTPAPAPKDFCADKKPGLYYKDPRSGKGLAGEWSCMKYHECVDGVDVVHHCFWLIPLWQYNPSTRGCKIFFRARCADPDPK